MNTDVFELQIRERLTRRELNMLLDSYPVITDTRTFGCLIFTTIIMTALIVAMIILAFLEKPDLFSYL